MMLIQYNIIQKMYRGIIVFCLIVAVKKNFCSYYCENLDIRDTIEARLDERDPASLIKKLILILYHLVPGKVGYRLKWAVTITKSAWPCVSIFYV